MSRESIILVGMPSTGKTNFLARLWEALRTKRGRLICPRPPDDIKYVEAALDHLLQGKFAPRSNDNINDGRSDVEFPIQLASRDAEATVVVPDITGELWKQAVKTLDIPARWLVDLEGSSGAILFVRIQSELNVDPLDWVTTRKLLRNETSLEQGQEELPTQVVLCELFRFLEASLRRREGGTPPRVAVLVAAWDRLDAAADAAGPWALLWKQFPLFAGRLADTTAVTVNVYGLSVVGGDLAVDDEFRDAYLASDDLSTSGYIVSTNGASSIKDPDVTLPLVWLLGEDSGSK